MNEDNLPDSPVQTETLETRVRKQMTEERKQQIDEELANARAAKASKKAPIRKDKDVTPDIEDIQLQYNGVDLLLEEFQEMEAKFDSFEEDQEKMKSRESKMYEYKKPKIKQMKNMLNEYDEEGLEKQIEDVADRIYNKSKPVEEEEEQLPVEQEELLTKQEIFEELLNKKK